MFFQLLYAMLYSMHPGIKGYRLKDFFGKNSFSEDLFGGFFF